MNGEEFSGGLSPDHAGYGLLGKVACPQLILSPTDPELILNRSLFLQDGTENVVV
jgi:hypothetical protein